MTSLIFDSLIEAANKVVELKEQGYDVEMIEEIYLVEREDGTRYDRIIFVVREKGEERTGYLYSDEE
jgi:hypothetical protein